MHTHCEDNYLPDEDGTQARLMLEAQERGCAAARSFEVSKAEREPQPTTGTQLITGCREAFPTLLMNHRKITRVVLVTLIYGDVMQTRKL